MNQQAVLRSPEPCLKMGRWQGPPQANKQSETVSSFKVGLFIQFTRSRRQREFVCLDCSADFLHVSDAFETSAVSQKSQFLFKLHTKLNSNCLRRNGPTFQNKSTSQRSLNRWTHMCVAELPDFYDFFFPVLLIESRRRQKDNTNKLANCGLAFSFTFDVLREVSAYTWVNVLKAELTCNWILWQCCKDVTCSMSRVGVKSTLFTPQ